MAKSNKTEEVIVIKVDTKSAEEELKKLTSAIGANKKTIKDNEGAVKALGAESKALAQAVKAGTAGQQAAAAAMENKTAKVKGLKAATQGLKEQSKDLAQQQKNNKEASVDQTMALAGMGGSLGAVRMALQAFGGGLKAVFTMMKSNPILLLAGILISLVAAFKKTKTGAELFRIAGAALNATMGVLMDVIEKLANVIIGFAKSAFEDPVQMMKDFGIALYDNYIKYFTETIPNALEQAFGGIKTFFEGLMSFDIGKLGEGLLNFVDGLTSITPGAKLAKDALGGMSEEAIKLAKEMARVAEKSALLEKSQIALEMLEAKHSVTLAKHRAEMTELKYTYDDVTQSDEARMEAIDKAVKAEEIAIGQTKALSDAKLEQMRQGLDLTNSLDEEVIAYHKAQAAAIDFTNGLEKKMVSLNTKRGAVQKSINDKNKKEADAEAARKQKAIDDQKKADDKAEAERKKAADKAEAERKKAADKAEADKKASNERGVALAKENIDTLAQLEKNDRDRKINELLDEANYNKTTLDQKLKGVKEYYDMAAALASEATAAAIS